MPVGNSFTILKSVKPRVPMVYEFVNVGGGVAGPMGLAFDSNNVLFAVCSGSYINKIQQNGTMSTFMQVITGGEAISLNFITIDKNDNIYTTDSAMASPGLAKYHNNIYVINSSGIMSTYVSGAGLTIGISIDKNMNLYVSDTAGPNINKYDSNKIVTVNFGNFSGFTSLKLPCGIAIDSNDDIYFADRDNHTINKITKNGTKSLYAGIRGTNGSSDGTNATFNMPYGLCFDENDNLYVSEIGNNKIRKITPSNVVTTVAGNGIQGDKTGVALQANFKNLGPIAYKDGVIYISDKGNNKIKKLIL